MVMGSPLPQAPAAEAMPEGAMRVEAAGAPLYCLAAGAAEAPGPAEFSLRVQYRRVPAQPPPEAMGAMAEAEAEAASSQRM